MNIYRYYDNSEGYHNELKFETEAENILEADTAYFEAYSYKPEANKFIGCTIDEFEGENSED